MNTNPTSETIPSMGRKLMSRTVLRWVLFQGLLLWFNSPLLSQAPQTNINIGSGALEVRLLYQGRPIRETLAESAIAVSAPNLFFRKLDENTNLISWTLPATNSAMRIAYTSAVFLREGTPDLLPPVPFQIVAGKTNVVTLDLCPPLGLLTGRVLLNGNPVSATLSFRDQRGNELLSTSSDESGLFRVLLPAGQGQGQVNLVQGQGAFTYTILACQTNSVADIHIGSGALEVHLLYQGRPIRETLADSAVAISAPNLFFRNLNENTNLISWTLPATNSTMRVLYTRDVFTHAGGPDLLPPVPFQIVAGKTNVVTLDLCPPLGLLTGRVLMNGNPISAGMTFRDLLGNELLSTYSDESGLFRVLLPAGQGRGQVDLVQGQGAFTYTIQACQTNTIADIQIGSGALEVHLLYQGRPIRETLADSAVAVSAPNLFFRNLDDNTNLISGTLPVTNTVMRIVYTSGVLLREGDPDLLPPVPIRIVAGKTNVVILDLCPPLGLLTGRVVLNGNPVAATMSFRDLRGNGFLSTSSDEGGLFRVLLPAGYGQGQVNLVHGQGTFAYSVKACQTNHLGDLGDPPSISLITDRTTLEDTATPAILFTVSDAEAPAASIEVSASSTNPALLPPGGIALGGSGANRTVTLTPAKDQSGVATVSLAVKDGGGLTATNRFELTVLPVNDPPTLASIADITMNEDAPAKTINFAGITSGAANESQTLFVTATSSNPDLIPNPSVTYTSPQATGSLSFQPLANANGTATIILTVKDSGGVDNGGKDTFSRQFKVTVNPVNDPPVVSLTAPNQGESFGFGTSIPLTAIASDIDSPVSKVEFFDGATKIGEDLTSPFTVAWSSAAIGDHTLTAKATDREGATTISASVHAVVVRVHTAPIGDILIIRNFADPEIDRLAEYLENPELKIFDAIEKTFRRPVVAVADQEGLEFADLTGFQLIIWDDLGKPGQGIRDTDVNLLWSAWNFGIPIYFIGEGLGLTDVPLSETARRQWTELVGLAPGGAVVTPGTITATEPVDRFNELFRGVLSDTAEVADFSYPRGVFPGRFVGNGEVRATMADAPVLTRYPDFSVERTGDVRRLVQSFLVTLGGSGSGSVEERRKLFLNGTLWLLGSGCDAFVASLECPDFSSEPEFGTCRPFKLSAKVSNNGECPAGGVTVTNVVAPGLEIIGTVVRTVPEGKATGFVKRDGQTVVYGIGTVPLATVVELETWVVAREIGSFSSTFSTVVNRRPGASCDQVVKVVESGCDCPSLEISKTGSRLALTIRTRCPVETILQTSTDLVNWANSRTNNPGVAVEILPVEVSNADPLRFFRLIFAH